MQRLRLVSGMSVDRPAPVVTVGNFDGVHRGHQALVETAVRRARETAGTAVVLTFDPHPSRVLTPARPVPALSTPRQKEELLEALSADLLIVLPFSSRLARLPPEEFVADVLASRLRAREVVVGRTFRFGHRQGGDVETLAALGRRHGFSVDALEPVEDSGAPVSSSRVREALLSGDVTAARGLLGRSYAIDGRVVVGDGRGRTIGVPTANLAPENELVPARGVYVARCRLGDLFWHPAVVNVGVRPTFGGTGVSVEAHLIDFTGDLYGHDVRLAFEARLRDERRFADKGALVAQIRDDIARARVLVPRRGAGGV